MSLLNGYRHPIIEGYVSTESFDKASLDGTLAELSYMIGYTMNDYRKMSDEIIDFFLNREAMGVKAWTYEFARYGDSNGPETCDWNPCTDNSPSLCCSSWTPPATKPSEWDATSPVHLINVL